MWSSALATSSSSVSPRTTNPHSQLMTLAMVLLASGLRFSAHRISPAQPSTGVVGEEKAAVVPLIDVELRVPPEKRLDRLAWTRAELTKALELVHDPVLDEHEAARRDEGSVRLELPCDVVA